MAEVHLDAFARVFEHEWLAKTHIPAFEGQTALERAIKGLLTANNNGARFRRDAARMWRHIESANPMGDRNGAQSVEALLNAHQRTGRARMHSDPAHGKLGGAGTSSQTPRNRNNRPSASIWCRRSTS